VYQEVSSRLARAGRRCDTPRDGASGRSSSAAGHWLKTALGGAAPPQPATWSLWSRHASWLSIRPADRVLLAVSVARGVLVVAGWVYFAFVAYWD
jgi:hypothetical protein